MSTGAVFALVLPAAYLLGAVPWGLLIARWSRGLDVREAGSGNIGSSNVLRTAGAKAAGAALLLDVAKGAAPVAAARLAASAADMTDAEAGMLTAGAAMAALLGHSWPVYLRFRGGKGVATGVGGLLVLHPWGGVAALLCALAVMRLSRYISLGSIVGVTVGAGALILLWLRGEAHWAYAVHAAAGWVVIVGRHYGNIQRLLAGVEARIGEPARPQPESGA